MLIAILHLPASKEQRSLFITTEILGVALIQKTGEIRTLQHCKIDVSSKEPQLVWLASNGSFVVHCPQGATLFLLETEKFLTFRGSVACVLCFSFHVDSIIFTNAFSSISKRRRVSRRWTREQRNSRTKRKKKRKNGGWRGERSGLGQDKGVIIWVDSGRNGAQGVSIARWGSLFASTGRIFQGDDDDDDEDTVCGCASLHSPDNGVTLQFHASVDLVYFSSLTFNHGARGPAVVPYTAAIISWKISGPRTRSVTDERRRSMTTFPTFLSSIRSRFTAVHEYISFVPYRVAHDLMQRYFSLARDCVPWRSIVPRNFLFRGTMAGKIRQKISLFLKWLSF